MFGKVTVRVIVGGVAAGVFVVVCCCCWQVRWMLELGVAARISAWVLVEMVVGERVCRGWSVGKRVVVVSAGVAAEGEVVAAGC